MTWTYEIITGKLLDDSGDLIAIGYSGDSEHKNNPEYCDLHSQGPIPPGKYEIGAPMDTLTHGPYVLQLMPDPENEMFGRSGFLIHGDSMSRAGTASHGCIVLPKSIRVQIWESRDHDLDVVERIPEETLV